VDLSLPGFGVAGLVLAGARVLGRKYAEIGSGAARVAKDRLKLQVLLQSGFPPLATIS
jgi:hypothetical protein